MNNNPANDLNNSNRNVHNNPNVNFMDKTTQQQQQKQDHARDAKLAGFERRTHEHNNAQRVTEQASRFMNNANRSRVPMALFAAGLGGLAYYYWPKMSRPRHQTMHAAEEVMHSTRAGLNDMAEQSKALRQSLIDEEVRSAKR